MAYLDTNTFVFNGTSLSSFGMMFGWIDDNENDTTTGLNRTIRETEMNFVSSHPSQYAVVYDECLEFSFAIFKTNQENITYQESRALNKWLTDVKTYKKLVFSGEQDIFYKVICTQVTDIVYNGFNAKKIVFRSDSPFGYSSPVKQKIVVTDEKSMKLFNNGDNGEYYPTIEIQSTDDSCTITNETDNKTMTIDFSLLDDKYVKFDCEKMRIVDKDDKLIPAYKVGWNEMDNIYWFRLLPEKNTITITGNCSVVFECMFPRKVGVL